MGIGKYGWNNEECKNVPYLTAEYLGNAREILFFRDGKQVKNIPQDKKNEVYFNIEKCVEVDGKKEFRSVKKGYMKRTEKLKEFFDYLFQDSRFNQHLHFVEWSDRYNCVVEDGIYISQCNFFMTKKEFEKFEKSIIPYDDAMKEYNKMRNHIE